MHRVSPITSPRADSKLKNWFRDRLVRRSSGPVPVYPHQPGPDFRSTSEIGFTGGAALTGSRAGSAAGVGETRGAALSSHPVTGMDLDTSPPRDRDSGNGNGGTFLEMTKTTTGDSASDSGRHNGNSNGHSNGNGNSNGNGGNSKRHRFRKSFMKTLSRNSNSQEPKTNGFANGGGTHSRQNSTFSETKVSGTGDGLRGLRDSAHEQGLPAPPILGQTASTGRESRFSEDL